MQPWRQDTKNGLPVAQHKRLCRTILQTLQQEALDRFIVFGQQHMDVLVREFVEHYHEERPHQGMHNELLVAVERTSTEGKADEPSNDVVPFFLQIACRERLGGVLKHYYRKAA